TLADLICVGLHIVSQQRRVTLLPYTTLFRSHAAPFSAAARTVSTGHGDIRTTFSAMLPMTKRSSPVLPCVPITIRSQPSSRAMRSEEHTSELQSLRHLVCRLLLEKKKERFGN